jgi:phosphatidate phosphatase APP1
VAAAAVSEAAHSSPHRIVAYRGYGTAARALVLGRVLRSAQDIVPTEGARWWRNAWHSWNRLDPGPYPHARVLAHAPGVVHEFEADDEGFVHHWVSPGPTTYGWGEITLSLAYAEHGDVSTAAEVLVPAPGARFGIISDLDDTVLVSRVSSKLQAARLLLFENALTRLPFPGVAAFYRALTAGVVEQSPNPLFYLSASPWNFYDVIDHFLDIQRIPAGPLLLRDWDLRPSLLRTRGHKHSHITLILDTYPGLPFILIGDSTQEDPEIYAEVVHDHPGRIMGVYIRNVFASPERIAAMQHLAAEVEKAGSSLVLADDTLAAAKHAAAHGWMDPAMLGTIEHEKEEDTGEAPGKDPAAEPPPDAPTVVVDDSLQSGEKKEIASE